MDGKIVKPILFFFILFVPIALIHARTNEFDTLLVQKGATVNLNLFAYEFISINTNASGGVGRSLTIAGRPGALNNFLQIMPPTVLGGSASLLVGDFVGAGPNVEFGTDGLGNIRLITFNATSLYFGVSGAQMLTLTPTTTTLGVNSSSILNIPGTTVTAANGLNFNGRTLSVGVNQNVAIATNELAMTGLLMHGNANASTGFVYRTVASVSSKPFLVLNPAGTGVFMVETNGNVTAANGNTTLTLTSMGNTSANGYTWFNASSAAGAFAVLGSGTNIAATTSLQSGSDGSGRVTRLTAAVQGVRIGTNSLHGTFISSSPATNAIINTGAIGIGTSYVTNFGLTGALTGSPCMAGPNVFLSGLTWSSYCTNTDVVTLSIANNTAGILTPAVHTNQVRVFNP